MRILKAQINNQIKSQSLLMKNHLKSPPPVPTCRRQRRNGKILIGFEKNLVEFSVFQHRQIVKSRVPPFWETTDTPNKGGKIPTGPALRASVKLTVACSFRPF